MGLERLFCKHNNFYNENILTLHIKIASIVSGGVMLAAYATAKVSFVMQRVAYSVIYATIQEICIPTSEAAHSFRI